MGACELFEHDSALRGHAEATHERHGTWSQRTTPVRPKLQIVTAIEYDAADLY